MPRGRSAFALAQRRFIDVRHTPDLLEPHRIASPRPWQWELLRTWMHSAQALSADLSQWQMLSAAWCHASPIDLSLEPLFISSKNQSKVLVAGDASHSTLLQRAFSGEKQGCSVHPSRHFWFEVKTCVDLPICGSPYAIQ